MKKRRNRELENRHQEKGFIWILGVIIVAFLLILAVPFLFQLSTERKMTEKSSKSLNAMSLAEAGAERAIWELNYGDIAVWADGGESNSKTFFGNLGSGSFNVDVLNYSSDNPVIVSTGSKLGVNRTVRIELEREPFEPWRWAVFGNSSVQIDQLSLIDSYDSSKGLYSSSNVGAEGNIATNSIQSAAITTGQNCTINGDLLCGAGGDPAQAIKLGASNTVVGSVGALPDSQYMPSINVPSLPFFGALSKGSSTSTTISASGEYSSFNVGKLSTITIQGDVTLYVSGAFKLGQGSNIVVSPGSSLTFIVGSGPVTFDQNAGINNVGKDPTKLQILGTDNFTGTLALNQSSDFYGAIYVPRAQVQINQAISYYGALAGNSVWLSQKGNLHYDEQLENWCPGSGLIPRPYKVQTWHQL